MNYIQDVIAENLTKIIEKLDAKLECFIKLSKKYSVVRLIVFIFAVLLFVGFYTNNYKTTATIIALSLGMIFIVLMFYHTKVEKSIKKIKMLIQIKKENLARLNLDWNNIPSLESSLFENQTFIEQDLNITEENGLLQLLNTGISFSSITLLRKWLNGFKADRNEIINRQKIIFELKEKTHFRERLLLTTRSSINKNILKEEISKWIDDESLKKGLKLYTIFLSLLCIISWVFIVGSITGVFSTFFYQPLLIYIFFYYAGAKYVSDTRNISEILFDEVRKYASVFSFIEEYEYGISKNLKNLLTPFFNKKKSPSKTLNKIKFTLEILSFGANPFVWIFFIAVLPIDFLLAIKVERFRKTIKDEFPIWLETWQSLEAYCSLATFAYLNPGNNFAEFNETDLLIEAENIGHPLIRNKEKITNNYTIDDSSRINIITGSNMSGKSTFLRTIGINTLLANAGSVVDAERFVLSKFNLYSCIKVSDSVVDGISYFYAEVKRLKFILDEIKSKEDKSLVLIDEIYKGTNNIERLIGSKAIVRYLSKQGIYGLISTHDLELVNIGEEVKDVRNYHFRELVENSKMTFDYKLLEGPCPTTNALKIMKIEGLPI